MYSVKNEKFSYALEHFLIFHHCTMGIHMQYEKMIHSTLQVIHTSFQALFLTIDECILYIGGRNAIIMRFVNMKGE